MRTATSCDRSCHTVGNCCSESGDDADRDGVARAIRQSNRTDKAGLAGARAVSPAVTRTGGKILVFPRKNSAICRRDLRVRWPKNLPARESLSRM